MLVDTQMNLLIIAWGTPSGDAPKCPQVTACQFCLILIFYIQNVFFHLSFVIVVVAKDLNAAMLMVSKPVNSINGIVILCDRPVIIFNISDEIVSKIDCISVKFAFLTWVYVIEKNKPENYPGG